MTAYLAVTRKLPSWEQAEAASGDQTASPLETFVYEYEPAGDDATDFRKHLAEVLNDSKAFLPKFLRRWSPEDNAERHAFHDRLSALLDWLKAFSAGAPDTVWEA